MSLPTRFLICLVFIASTAWARPDLPENTPNGILIDRVVPMAKIPDLNGSSDAPAIGLARWRQTLFELQNSSDDNLGWPHPRKITSSPRADVSLSLIHARYDLMKTADEIASADVFAMAALQDALYYGADVTFVLESELLFAHQGSPLVQLAFDADDGTGLRPLTWDVPTRVSYASPGPKTLVITAKTNDGRELTAKASIVVKRLVTPPPTDTWAITATEPFQGSVATGQAYLYLAPGHTSLTNPVVIVEGFDLDNSMDWPVLYDLLNQQNMLEELNAEGFDAVVLDFTEATEPIQRNAFVLTELLAQVNNTTPVGKTSVVIGASMGGLVSRYALTWLESQTIDHQVRTYVSFDSPHGGANIPLGLQHWLDFFQGDSVDAAFLLSRLDTPAARQMLLHHHQSTSSASAQADPARAVWLADMAGTGDWPQVPRLVSVANGSGTGLGQGFAPGAQIISYEYRSLLVDIDGNVWAVPDLNGTATIFDGEQNLIWPLPDVSETVVVQNSLPWDSAPGGSRGSMAQMDATAAPYGDIIALHDDHSFIPTVSALALAGVDPYFNISTAPNLASLTPFDQVYWPDANQPHITITPQNKPWFMAEIQDGVSAVPTLISAGVELHGAVPNPFNPLTKIGFRLAKNSSAVSLDVYDLAGRRVQSLIAAESFAAGEHSAIWQGRDETGRSVPSGIYFVRLQAQGQVKTGRLLLVK